MHAEQTAAPSVDKYYLLINDEAVGPMALSEIAERLHRGKITPVTLFSYEGASTWQPVHTLHLNSKRPQKNSQPIIFATCLAAAVILGLALVLHTPAVVPEEDVRSAQLQPALVQAFRNMMAGARNVIITETKDNGRGYHWRGDVMVEGLNVYGGPAREPWAVEMMWFENRWQLQKFEPYPMTTSPATEIAK